ncbi:MAG TPA: aminotransferase class I/II-fold pyridoxal phosphate-dependent enzyme [Vicinamibacterales bacterium]|nr:aminotransferase class I/II-fold pyridoxal phosphate-dependent enzyme [Vicinamibacterales bacterium]
MKTRGSRKATQFTESVIREMTRLAQEFDAVNLSQGFPDFATHQVLKDAACAAIQGDINQYPITWGAENLREAIARDFSKRYGVKVDATQVTVCCGSTEAMLSTLLAVVDPGDEVIIFEPYYENYGPDSIISGAVPRFVRLREPDWTFDRAELEAAFNNHTRAIIINTPNNPTGKVFTKEELEFIAKLCLKWDVLAITDEIYEHIIYDGHKHVPMASITGMPDRTITINGLSKTFSVTGWRVGWAIAPSDLAGPIRKMHDFLTVGAPAPLQEAGAVALAMPESYYTEMAAGYARRREILCDILERHGFKFNRPQGAYYIMTDVAHFGFDSDIECSTYLVKECRVATVPGSSFFNDKKAGRTKVRFVYSKREETLREADKRLAKLATRVTR